MLLVISIPFYPIISWYRGPTSDSPETTYTEIDSDADSRSVVGSSIYVNGKESSHARRAPQSEFRRSASEGYPPNGLAPNAIRRPSDQGSKIYAPRQVASEHQIWYPSSSAHDDDEASAPSDPLPASVPHVPTSSGEATAADDWRAYPAFPSAYPPTPLPTNSRLAMPEPRHASSNYAPILEHDMNTHDDDPGLPDSAASANDVEPHFSRSLLQPREPVNPSSVGGLSDDVVMSGVQEEGNQVEYAASEEEDDDDDEYIDEEDDFDVTLRTPPPRQTTYTYPMLRAPSNMSIATVATVASSTEASTASEESTAALTTVGHASTLRTGSNSGSSATSTSTSDTTDSSSAIGKKRPWPHSTVAAKSRIRAMSQLSPSKVGRRRSSTVTRLRPVVSKSSSLRANWEGPTPVEASGAEGEEGMDEEGESQLSASASKRRKVLDAAPRVKAVGAVRAPSYAASRLNGKMASNGATRSNSRPIGGDTKRGAVGGPTAKLKTPSAILSSRLIATRTSLRAAHTRSVHLPAPHSGAGTGSMGTRSDSRPTRAKAVTASR